MSDARQQASSALKHRLKCFIGKGFNKKKSDNKYGNTYYRIDILEN
ncbi:hypothetical protein PIECOFPK_01299 [Mycovorax composti]|jgi:hypothetical protein|uniref:Uncharacterized protein n=1 Tax=Mycovorax composti TaxID=2962693 RepID=A0ABZ2EJA5_9BACT